VREQVDAIYRAESRRVLATLIRLLADFELGEKTMKYMMMGLVDRNSQAYKDYEAGKPPDPKLMEAIGKQAEKMAKAGILLGTGGLLPYAKGVVPLAYRSAPTSAFGRIIFSRDISKSSPWTFHPVGGARIRRVGR